MEVISHDAYLTRLLCASRAVETKIIINHGGDIYIRGDDEADYKTARITLGKFNFPIRKSLHVFGIKSFPIKKTNLFIADYRLTVATV